MIYLERFTGNTPYGIFGKMVVGDLELFTVEQPWRDNKPSHSCIPAGEYMLEPHSSAKYGECWALVNTDLGIAHYPTNGVPRSTCLIHPANIASQLEGCVAPGLRLGMVNNEWAVTNSRQAMDRLRIELLGEHRILITHPQVSYAKRIVADA